MEKENIGNKLDEFENIKDEIYKCKKNNKLYRLKKYTDLKLSLEKIKEIITKLIEFNEITQLKYLDFFQQENNTYFISEYFDGKMLSSKDKYKTFYIWKMSEKILNVFEKLQEKGIDFSKNNKFEVYLVRLSEYKIDCLQALINNNIEEKKEGDKEKKEGDKEKKEGDKEKKYTLLSNFANILKLFSSDDNYFNGFLNDINKGALNLEDAKKLIKILFKYQFNTEIIEWNGMIYSGPLKEGKPNGKGKLYTNKDSMDLEFKDGLVNGKNIYLEDEFCDEKINKQKKGPILLYNENCKLVFDGFYENGEKTGKGVIYKNQSKHYEGYFKNGKKEGKGVEYKLYYGDQDITKYYDGYFSKDLYNGDGKIFSPKGNIKYSGNFKDGKKEGKGIEYYENCYKKYEGTYLNDLFDGKGNLFYENGGVYYSGEFKEGKIVGKGIVHNFYGTEIALENGIPNIPKVELNKNMELNLDNICLYYFSGSLHYKIDMRKERLYGEEYYKDGKLKYKGELLIVNKDKKENVSFDFGTSLFDKLFKYNGKGQEFIDESGESRILYNGYFLNGLYEGNGTLYYSSYPYYVRYEGNFKNGRFEGKGIEYDSEVHRKIKYQGMFKDGIYNGKGKYYEGKNIEYKGVFKNGYLINGMMTNNEYIGNIKDGKKDGDGKVFINGILRFKGKFKADEFLEGIIYTKDSKQYFEGQMGKDNIISGKFYYDGNIFEGRQDDFLKITNYAIFFNNKCNILYEGGYRNGMKFGLGNDGQYEGEFLYNMYYGKGNLYNCYEGEYKYGKRSGFWKEYDYEGEYRNGLKEGKGKCNSWEGEYFNGYLHGENKKNSMTEYYLFGEKITLLNYRTEGKIIYFNDKKYYEGDLNESGIKHGKGIEFYQNGNKLYEGEFKNGKHNGTNGIMYYENGNKRFEGEFKNGKFIKGKEFDKDIKDQIIYVGDFKNLKYNGKGELYINGKKIYEGAFKDDKLCGTGTEYDLNNNKSYIGEFDNNSYNGKGTKFSPIDGSIIFQGIWKNNQPDKLKTFASDALGLLFGK